MDIAQDKTSNVLANLINWLGQFLSEITGGAFDGGTLNKIMAAFGLATPAAGPGYIKADANVNAASLAPDLAPEVGAEVPEAGTEVLEAEAVDPTVNPATEYSMENFLNPGEMSFTNAFGLLNAAVNGFGDGVMSMGASALGQVADVGDQIVGELVENTVGYDTGFKGRDMSKSFNDVVMEKMGMETTLTSTYQDAAYRTGNIGSWFIPVGGVATLGAKAINGIKAMDIGGTALEVGEMAVDTAKGYFAPTWSIK